jgi:hypothetical protein
MAKKTVHIELDQSSQPATIKLTLVELQDDGSVSILELSDNDVIEINLNEVAISEAAGMPYFEFFPKSIPGLQWRVDFSADSNNPNRHIASPFDEQSYLSDETDNLSEGVNPDEPPDSNEDAPISAEVNDDWAVQVQTNEVWEFDYTVSFVANNAQPITRRLRGRRM